MNLPTAIEVQKVGDVNVIHLPNGITLRGYKELIKFAKFYNEPSTWLVTLTAPLDMKFKSILERCKFHYGYSCFIPGGTIVKHYWRIIC